MAYQSRQSRGGGGYQSRGRSSSGGGRYGNSRSGGGDSRRREDDYGDSILVFEANSDNPKAPTFNGVIKIDGREYEFGAWEKTGKNGLFWAGNVEPKQDRRRGEYERGRERDDRSEDRRGNGDKERSGYRDSYRDDDAPPPREHGDPGPSDPEEYGGYR